MAGFVEVIGDIELFAKLNDLAGPVALKCARQGIMSGLVPLNKAIRQQVNATTIPPSKERAIRHQLPKKHPRWVSAREIKDKSAEIKKVMRESVGRRMVKARLSAAKTKSGVIEVLSSRGTIQGKTGFKVAKKQVDLPQRQPPQKGVGMGVRNVHWWVLGTKERRTKTGRRTGKMRAYFPNVVPAATAQAGGEVTQVMAARMKAVIESEARKGR